MRCAAQRARSARRFLRFFEERGHRRVAELVAGARGRPDAALHERGHGAVQARLPRRGDARLQARHHLAEVHARLGQAQRSRERRPHAAPPHVLRDARQLLVRRLLQAATRSAGPGSSSPSVYGHARREARRHGVPRGRRGRARSGREEVGVPADRIARLDEADNFWSMGDTGPCGPCSRDLLRPAASSPAREARTATRPTTRGRWLEIWNLVFMQFDRDASGTMTPLPRPCVDTGAGLERMSRGAPGRDLELRHRSVHGRSSRARRSSRASRLGTRPREGRLAARGRRPRARGHVPDRRRRAALERGARLRAAPDPAPRGAPRRAARPRAPVPARGAPTR